MGEYFWRGRIIQTFRR